MDSLVRVSVDVNDRRYERDVEPRLLLSDFLRHELGLTGTHVGCEHGVCGACTVLFDGEPVALVPHASRCRPTGTTLQTVEGLAPAPATARSTRCRPPSARRTACSAASARPAS